MTETPKNQYLTLDEMLGGSKTIDVVIEEGKPPVSLTFNPNYYTSEYEMKMENLNLDELPASKIAAHLFEILTSASFEEKPTLATLNRIYFGHNLKMIRAIQEFSRGNLMAAETSVAG